MSKKRVGRGTFEGHDSSGESPSSPPIDKLRQRIDQVVGTPCDDWDADLIDWAERVAQSGVIRRMPLSDEALALVAELTPAASVTSEFLSRVRDLRETRRASARAEAELAAECDASCPSDLFQRLRERAGMSHEQTAMLFGVTPSTWVAIEQQRMPWHKLPGDRIPAFASAIQEPVERLVTLLGIVARRALFVGIELRSNFALGRFDAADSEARAKRDTLRMAFARVEEENRGAAAFLAAAQRAVRELNDSQSSDLKPRSPHGA